MNHRWKKYNYKKNAKVVDIIFENTKYIPMKVQQCIHCGLLKGIVNIGYIKWFNQYRTIYFEKDNNKILSEGKIPYKCTGKIKDFLSKDDFNIKIN